MKQIFVITLEINKLDSEEFSNKNTKCQYDQRKIEPKDTKLWQKILDMEAFWPPHGMRRIEDKWRYFESILRQKRVRKSN